jgi:hypothetical protein
VSETPDTPSTEALTPERLAEALERWYPNSPNPSSAVAAAIIAGLDAERAVRQEAADTSGHLHLDFCSGGAFCPLDDCLCECHLPDLSSAVARQEAADTSGHGPCDYNGGPGSDQCPHGVFFRAGPLDRWGRTPEVIAFQEAMDEGDDDA